MLHPLLVARRALTSPPPNRLRELRGAAREKRHQIGALVDRDSSTVHRYETGETNMPDQTKLILAAHFGVSVEYLMGWDRIENAA